MKQIRKNFSNLKAEFYSGKTITYRFVNCMIQLWIRCLICIGIFAITAFLSYLLGGRRVCIFVEIFMTLLGILLILDKLPFMRKPVKNIADPIFRDFFGKYGNVINKEDWKRIKAFDKSLPREERMISRKKAYGQCYAYSWMLATALDDAQLLYGSITLKDGSKSCHSAILKNNCVFDTNNWIHYDYEEYIQGFGVDIFKMYSYEEYDTSDFFDNIRSELREWCHQNDVYITDNF